MNWINISEINKHPDIEGKSILVWQKNLTDPECSRFQRAVFYKGDEDVPSFMKLYPEGSGSGYIYEDKEWKHRDLEGDLCQLTHFSIVNAPVI